MAQDQIGEPRRLKIRKYPNRRYYDTTRSRHVTLEEINSLIRQGYEVQVTDSKTGQDITAKVLAQIILELDSPKLGIFPVPLLHRLIRANEQLVNDFVQKYFNQALTAFLDSQGNFEQSFRQAIGLQSAIPGVADWTKLMLGPLASPRRGTANSEQEAATAGSPPTGSAAPSEEARELRHQLDELRRQFEALQQQIASPKRKPRSTNR